MTDQRKSFAELGLWAILGVWVVHLALGSIVDGDIWFHLAGGRYTLAHGRPPLTDPFSYPAEGRPYICLHWLFQICAYGCYALGRVFGLVALKAALILGLVLLACGALELKPTDGSLALLYVVVLGCSATLTIRPLLLSLLYLMACLIAWRQEARPWLFPLIALLWVNTHGLFILGVFVAGVWALERPRERAAWLLLTVAACFANPYCVRGVLFPFTLFTRIGARNVYSENIQEFASPFRNAFFLSRGAGWACLLLAACCLAAFVAARRRLPRRRLALLALLFAGFLFIYLLAFRNMAPFAVVTGWILVQLAPEVRSWQARALRWRVAVLVLVLLGVIGFEAQKRVRGFPGVLRQHSAEKRAGRLATFTVPERAVAFLQDRQWSGRMFNDFNWGGYLIFRLGPETRAFIDPRLEVHTLEHFSRYVRLVNEPQVFLELDREYDFDAAVFAHFPFRGLPALCRLLHENDAWRLVYGDETAVIFCKQRETNAALLADPVAPLPEPLDFEVGRGRYLTSGLQECSPWKSPELTATYGRVGTGQLLMHLGKPRAGLAHLLGAAALSPQIGEVHFLVASAALAAGDGLLFVRACDYLWIVQPGHPELSNLLALGRERFGNLGARTERAGGAGGGA